MFLPTKNKKQDNILADGGHFVRTETHSTDFKNENLTIKIRTNKAQKPHFLRKRLQKIFKQTKPSNKIRTSKNIREKNKSNKIA